MYKRLVALRFRNSSSMNFVIYFVTVFLIFQSLRSADCFTWDLDEAYSYDFPSNKQTTIDPLSLFNNFERVFMHCTIPLMRTLRDVHVISDWRYSISISLMLIISFQWIEGAISRSSEIEDRDKKILVTRFKILENRVKSIVDWQYWPLPEAVLIKKVRI